jgi:hypothetical protein
MISDPFSVSNIFNDYFGSVYSRDDNQAAPRCNVPTHNPMPTVVFDPAKIKNILCSMKSSSPGPDNIHPKVVKNLANKLATPLSIIFAKSYNSSTLPSIWKMSHVCSIYKGSGCRFLPENYRPVALTSVVCKVMETIIKDISFSIYQVNLFFPLFSMAFCLNGQPSQLCYLQHLIG